MEAYKKTIVENLLNGNDRMSETQYRVHSKISDAVDYAWNNWDDNIVATYYKGEKPEKPTADFIENWVENEDFEADGYDVTQLKEIFA